MNKPTKQIPPQALHVEKSILGSIITYKNALDYGIANIKSEYFFDSVNRGVFDIIFDLYNNCELINDIVIIDKISTKCLLDDSLIDAYINDVINVSLAVEDISKHVEILKEKYNLRTIIEKSQQAIADCYLCNSSSKIISEINNDLNNITDISKQSKFYTIKELLSDAFDTIEMYKRKGEVSGIPTMFTDLDKKTTGFHPGELIILAGRPGTGKTALSLSMASNTAYKGNSVVYFSLEMSKEQIVQRILCSNACVDIHRVRSGQYTISELKLLGDASSGLHQMKFIIDDTTSISIVDIKSKLIQISKLHRIDFIVIDYLQLMSSVGKYETDQVAVSNISKSLKKLAKEFNVPVLALSQLSRAVEARSVTSHRPQLSDLRSSGSIEQDADLVLLIYYDYMYSKDASMRNMSELIVAKQRNGSLGSINLSFIPEYTRFDNLAQKIEENDRF